MENVGRTVVTVDVWNPECTWPDVYHNTIPCQVKYNNMSLQRGNKIRVTTTTTTTTTHPNQPIIVTRLLQVVKSLDLTQLHTIFHHVHVEVNEPWPWSWLFPTSLALGMDFWGNFLREGWRVMWPEYWYFCRFHIYIRYIPCGIPLKSSSYLGTKIECFFVVFHCAPILSKNQGIYPTQHPILKGDN